MALHHGQLDLRIKGCALALSARRVWEHTEFGQVNPFAPVPTVGAVQAHAYVDVVNMSGPIHILTGLTLQQAVDGRHSGVFRTMVNQLLQHLGAAHVRQWLAQVEDHLRDFTEKRAARNMPQPFIVSDAGSPFGVQGLHSALQSWLREHRAEKANLGQWQQRIDNLAMKGLRADELAFSGLADAVPGETDTPVDGDAVSATLQFDALRLSILPVVSPAIAQLEFTRVPANADVKRVKPKLKRAYVSRPQWQDRVLGYWIDVVEWDDLLGPVRTWMAFTHCGEAVVSSSNPSGLCTTLDEARELANRHAEKVFPKMSTQGDWSDYRLTGGVEYREWLVTLPYFAPSYFCRHFRHRNVLLHFRCDLREGAQGERVLLLQEVQSDWAQQARRELQDKQFLPGPVPPWLQEWPAFALKLALLHAVQRGADALAWTPGSVQARRYGGHGKAGLAELYDRTLLAEANRLLQRQGTECGTVEMYLPENFYIEPAEVGYEVMDNEGRLLATASTWEEARTALPDGAHEVLMAMHGIVLDAALKKAILQEGFFAWGNGVR